MLATQVSYWANQESKRHNLETESQNLIDLERRAKEYELSIKQLNETIRHNKTSETIDSEKAKAAITQAEAAKKQASVALKRIKNDIKATKANIEVARSNVALNNARTSLTKAQTVSTYATAKGTTASTAKTKQETKVVGKKNKYFLITDIINPMFTNVAKVVSAIK